MVIQIDNYFYEENIRKIQYMTIVGTIKTLDRKKNLELQQMTQKLIITIY